MIKQFLKFVKVRFLFYEVWKIINKFDSNIYSSLFKQFKIIKKYKIIISISCEVIVILTQERNKNWNFVLWLI